MDISGDFLAITEEPDIAAVEIEAIPRVFRKSRRVVFLGMNNPFHLMGDSPFKFINGVLAHIDTISDNTPVQFNPYNSRISIEFRQLSDKF